MARPNEDLLRRGYEAFGAGDIDTVLSIFADDIDWHVGGDNQISGDYHGHQEVLGFFGKLMELSAGTFRLDVHDILANDVHLSDGKAMEFWVFAEDQAALDQFFG